MVHAKLYVRGCVQIFLGDLCNVTSPIKFHGSQFENLHSQRVKKKDYMESKNKNLYICDNVYYLDNTRSCICIILPFHKSTLLC